MADSNLGVVDKHSLIKAYELVLRLNGILPIEDQRIYEKVLSRFQ